MTRPDKNSLQIKSAKPGEIVRSAVALMMLALSGFAFAQNPASPTLQDPPIAAGQETSPHKAISPYIGPFTIDLNNLPADWDWELTTEPFWRSSMSIFQAGMSNQQTLLLVHGIGGDGFKDWTNVIPTLAQKYHVIGVDLPGFGRSAAPAERYSPENYSRLLSWVATQYAHNPVVVIGHSMGGAVSLQYAADFPHQVKRVILVDAAGVLERTALLSSGAELTLDTQGLPDNIRRFGAQVIDFGRSLIEWTGSTPDPTGIIGENDAAWEVLFAGRPSANAGMALVMHDFSQAINSVKQDTFLIWGANDRVAPLRTGYLLAGRMPNAGLSIIKEAAHVPMKSHPRAFTQQLLGSIEAPQPTPFFRNQYSDQKPLLSCKDKHDVSYSGNYEKVIIQNCTGVTLKNFRAKELIIESSLVSMMNVTVENKEGEALSASGSTISATNANFVGKIAIASNGCRWDLAGVSIRGIEKGVVIHGLSQFIFSVSDIETPQGKESLHAVYKLTPGLLEDRL